MSYNVNCNILTIKYYFLEGCIDYLEIEKRYISFEYTSMIFMFAKINYIITNY